MILVGNKHKIIITQEEIHGREIVEVNFMADKKRSQHLGGKHGRMRSRREIWDRNLGSELQGRENVGLHDYGDIIEKLEKDKADG